MDSRRLISAISTLIVGLAVLFIARTLLVPSAPWRVTAVAETGVAALTLLLIRGKRTSFALLRDRTRWHSALAGALALLVVPALVASNRYSGAPSGTESLFFSVCAWSLIAVIALRPQMSPGAWRSGLLWSLIGLTGVMVLLGNWERPSSFSPLVRYPREEILMLVAGFVWVGAILIASSRMSESDSAPRVFDAGLAGVAALACSFVAALFVGPDRISELVMSETLVVLAAGIAAAVSFTSAVELATSSPRWVAAALLAPPILLTVSSAVEPLFAMRGVSPIQWPAALSGIALALTAITGLVVDGKPDAPETQPRVPRRRFLPVVAWVSAAVCAGVALSAPLIQASASGELGNGEAYQTAWQVMGWESAAGWIVALSAVLCAMVATSSRHRLVRVLGAVACALAAPVAAGTPLRVWTRWIPAAVQQDYGSEYATLVFEPRFGVALRAYSTAVIVVCVIVLAVATRSGSSTQEGK